MCDAARIQLIGMIKTADAATIVCRFWPWGHSGIEFLPFLNDQFKAFVVQNYSHVSIVDRDVGPDETARRRSVRAPTGFTGHPVVPELLNEKGHKAAASYRGSNGQEWKRALSKKVTPRRPFLDATDGSQRNPLERLRSDRAPPPPRAGRKE
jgi:hypothetical protein